MNNFSIYNEQNNTFNNFMLKVFGFMAIALAISALSAYSLIFKFPALLIKIINFRFSFVVIFLGLIFVMSTIRKQMFRNTSFLSTFLMLVIFSILVSLSLVYVSLMFKFTTIFLAFATTCIYFVALVVIGLTTGIDFTKFRNLAFVALIVFIVTQFIYGLVGYSSLFVIISSFVGISLFTVYGFMDIQTARNDFYQIEISEDRNLVNKLAIYHSLNLYLDFINIFSFIISIIGGREE